MSIKFRWFVHTGVDPDGNVEEGGNVRVDGAYFQSPPEGGCGSPGCTCSPGHWVTKIFPRTSEGIVAGYTAHFRDRAELERSSREALDEMAEKARH